MYDYHNNLTAGARGVVAVVGLAVRPQAGLVLPGGPRRRHDRGDLRRRQPRDLVAGHAGDGVRRLAGVRPAEPRPRPDRDRVRLPVGRLGPDRPGGVPVPLLHEPAVPDPRPRLLPRRAVARRVAADVALRTVAAGVAILGPGDPLAPRPARCAASSAWTGRSRTPQACPPIIPEFVAHRPDAAIAVVVGVSCCVVVRLFIDSGRDGATCPDGSASAAALLPARPRSPAGRSSGSLVAIRRSCRRRARSSTTARSRSSRVALIVALPRSRSLAVFVATARDARRFVVGVVVGGGRLVRRRLPELLAPCRCRPSIANVYQGVLPTYLYPFQFPVNNRSRAS